VKRAVKRWSVPELASRDFPPSKIGSRAFSMVDGKMLFRLFNCSNTTEQEYNGFQII
jgi:hypothetical protein